MSRYLTLTLSLCVFASVAIADDAGEKTRVAARDRGLAWLAKNQAADGSWGKQYTIAVTSFSCLAQVAAADEPFDGDQGRSLIRGLNFLLAKQKEGMFEPQGHSWIHGQGFATLASCACIEHCLEMGLRPEWGCYYNPASGALARSLGFSERPGTEVNYVRIEAAG